MINTPPPVTPFNWRNDPATFQGFPEFFMAHELAHQWFGQAVGWKNYHEQWLSEGFAQYFAALFARDRRGEGLFRDILRQFRRWSIEDSDQGPVYLGYRLGHIKGETRVFRALVYNKGAAVLHMLRGLVGDEAFFKGLRRFYAENRFKKAGTDDLRKAMEAESGRKLERFFEQWIYDSMIPRMRFASSVEGQELIVRFEQIGEVFDVPVLVTVTYADGKTAEHLVAVTEASVERRFPLAPAEGWTTLGLVLLLSLTLAWSIDDAAWVIGPRGLTDFLPWTIALGVGWGFLSAKVGWRRLVAHLLGAIFEDPIAPGDVDGLGIEAERSAFVLASRAAVGKDLKPSPTPAVKEGAALGAPGRRKVAWLAQWVRRTPQDIHIQRLIEALYDFGPLVNKDDELERLVLQDQSAVAMPGNLVLHAAAPVTIRIRDREHAALCASDLMTGPPTFGWNEICAQPSKPCPGLTCNTLA